MIAIPAIDLREGAVVQLVGGDYDREQVREDDAGLVLARWLAAGFARVHFVDLDAATGRGSNAPLIAELVARAGVPAQVGGGLRTRDAVADVLSTGAQWAVVGTRAVEDAEWLAEVAHDWPGRIIVAADVRERQVVTRGWAKALPTRITDFVEETSALPLGGLLVTAVHKEGQLQGTDLSLFRDVVDAAACPVIASGGITTLADLRHLEDAGVAGAVLGMALYTGALDPRLVAEEFAA